MKLDTLFQEFIEKKKAHIKESTINLYIRMFRLHFDFFKGIEIEQFTAAIVDDWLTHLRVRNQNVQRLSFDHELTLLKTLVNYYWDEHDVKLDIFKKRHINNAVVKKRIYKLNRELKEDEFKLFAHWLNLLYGEQYTMLAIIQYYQALRISEAFAIHYDCFSLDYKNPLNSTLTIKESVVFTHETGKKSKIQQGFKNGLIKVQPLLPQVFFYIKDRLEQYRDKYLFFENTENIPEFYKIKNAYTKAFKRANLPYSSTHILRHGGCSRIYNLSGGNIIVASQLLGNSEQETIKTYAHGYNETLSLFTKSLYNNFEK